LRIATFALSGEQAKRRRKEEKKKEKKKKGGGKKKGLASGILRPFYRGEKNESPVLSLVVSSWGKEGRNSEAQGEGERKGGKKEKEYETHDLPRPYPTPFFPEGGQEGIFVQHTLGGKKRRGVRRKKEEPAVLTMIISSIPI